MKSDDEPKAKPDDKPDPPAGHGEPPTTPKASATWPIDKRTAESEDESSGQGG